MPQVKVNTSRIRDHRSHAARLQSDLDKRDRQLSELLNEKTQLVRQLSERPSCAMYDALLRENNKHVAERDALRKQLSWIGATAISKLLGIDVNAHDNALLGMGYGSKD